MTIDRFIEKHPDYGAGQQQLLGAFKPSWIAALGGHFRRIAFGIPLDRLLHSVDDQTTEPGMRFRLVRALQVGMRSYNIAMETSTAGLGLHLQSLAPELRGIGIEGASTALFFRDRMRLGRPHIRLLTDEPYAPYAVFRHAGCGMLLAQFRRPIAPYLRTFSDTSSCMVINSYGFGRTVLERNLRPYEVAQAPGDWSVAERRIFDQGSGRALLFKLCGKTDALDSAIRKMPRARLRDLWLGVGSAMAFNIGPREAMRVKQELASANVSAVLAAGACMATWVRELSGCRTEETDLVGEILANADASRQLEIVRSQAPKGTAVSSDQWVEWWDGVASAF